MPRPTQAAGNLARQMAAAPKPEAEAIQVQPQEAPATQEAEAPKATEGKITNPMPKVFGPVAFSTAKGTFSDEKTGAISEKIAAFEVEIIGSGLVVKGTVYRRMIQRSENGAKFWETEYTTSLPSTSRQAGIVPKDSKSEVLLDSWKYFIASEAEAWHTARGASETIAHDTRPRLIRRIPVTQ